MNKISQKTRPCFYIDIPSIEYNKALQLQRTLVAAKMDSILNKDVFLCLEHPPVYTLGRRGDVESLKVSEKFLEAQGIEVIRVERGGDITYHGPGQMIIYPIFNIKSAKFKVIDFVKALEEIMIRILADWGIEAGRNDLNRGVWVGSNKIGSVGIAVQRSISFHGLALNVNTNLEHFNWVHPCGLKGVGATSMKHLLGINVEMRHIRQSAMLHLQEILEVRLEKVDLKDLVHILEDKIDVPDLEAV